MSQSSLGMFGDDEEDYSQADTLPLHSEDRASESLLSPNHQIPSDEGSVSEEAANAPSDDAAPRPAAAPQDQSTSEPQPQATPVPTPQGSTSVASPQPAATRVVGQATSPFSVLDTMQPPGPVLHQAGATPQDEAAMEARDQNIAAQQQHAYEQKRAGMLQYFHQQGLQTEMGPDGRARVQTDESGNPVWQPAVSAPYQDDQGRWVVKQRDASGQLSETDMEGAGMYKVDPHTGARYIAGPLGQHVQIGTDQPTVDRLNIAAGKAQLAQQNAQDRLALRETVMAIQPLAQQVKTLEQSAIDVGPNQGTVVGQLEKSIKLGQAANPDPDSVEGKILEAQQQGLAQYMAKHPEYAQAKAALAAAQQGMTARRQAILDRQDMAQTLAANPHALTASGLVGQSYQDAGSVGGNGQASPDNIQLQTAAQAARAGSSQLDALPSTLARLKALGITVPPQAPTQPVTQPAQPAPKAAGTDLSDLGARLLQGNGDIINSALKGAAHLIGWKGGEDYFESNKDTLAGLVNHSNDGSLLSKLAYALGGVVGTVPATAAAAATAPEAIGAGAVGLLARGAGLAWHMIPLATQFAAAASSDAHDAAIADGKSEEEANKAGGTAALGTLKALPVYALSGAVAGKVASGIMGRVVANPELVNPFMKGVAAFFTHTAGNIAGSTALRAMEGQPAAPTAENILPDVAFGMQGGLSEGAHQSEFLKSGGPAQSFFGGNGVGKGWSDERKQAYVPIAKAILAGEEPSTATFTKMAQDASLPQDTRVKSAGAAMILRDNARDFLKTMGHPAGGEETPTTPASSDNSEQAYRGHLNDLDRTKAQFQEAEGDEVTRAGLVDKARETTAAMHGMVQDRIDTLPEAEREVLAANAGNVDPDTVEDELRANPAQAFAAQAVGSHDEVFDAYVPRELRGEIAARIEKSSDPEAARVLFNRHVGMQAASDLWDIANDRAQQVSPQRLEALSSPHVGLVKMGADNKPVITTDGAALMRANHRAQMEGKRVETDEGTATPGATFQSHVRSGQDRAYNMFRDGVKRPAILHHVEVTSKAPGETEVTSKTVPVKAQTPVEAEAKAMTAAERQGHEVHESKTSVLYHPSRIADFSPEGQKAVHQVVREYANNKKLFDAIGVKTPAMSRILDREGNPANASGIAVMPDGRIHLDGDLLAKSFKALEAMGIPAAEWARHALREELIHRAQFLGAEKAGVDYRSFYSDLANDPKLPQGLRDFAARTYVGFDQLSDWMKGMEMTRMVIQKRWTGTITERIAEAVRHVAEFLTGIKLKGSGSELLDEAIRQTDEVLTEARRQAGEETEGLVPKEPQPTQENATPTEQPVQSSAGPPEASESPETLREGTSTAARPAGGGERDAGGVKPDEPSWDANQRGGPEPAVGPDDEAGRAFVRDALKKETEALKPPTPPKDNPIAASAPKEDYRGSHEAPGPHYGSRGDDLTDMFGDEIYGENAARHFGTGDTSGDKKALSIIASMRGNPEQEVTVYRAIPKGSDVKINSGDWVAITKDYAGLHGEFVHGENGSDIISKKVRADELWNAGDIQEFGYHADKAISASAPRDYAEEEQRVIKSNVEPEQAEPTADESKRIEDAYRELVAKDPDRFPSQRIADVMERADMPLNDESKGKLLSMHQAGKIVSMPAGDWSANDARTHAWGIPREGDSPALMMRMEPEQPIAASTIRDLPDAVRSLFAPATRGKNAEDTSFSLRERSAELARRQEVNHAAYKDAKSSFDKMLGPGGKMTPEVLQFIDDIENGRQQSTPQLEAIAKPIRESFDKLVREIQAMGTGALSNTIQNYFPHIWKDPKAAQSFLTSYFGKRPIEGSKDFLKKRTIPMVKDGLSWRVNDKEGDFVKSVPDEATAQTEASAIGGSVGKPLELVSNNPIDLSLLKLHEMNKYLTAQRFMLEERDKGRAVFVPATRKGPDGWAKIDDPIGTVSGPSQVQGLSAQQRQNLGVQQSFVNARTIKGHWWMPEESARVVNNYLGPGLAGNPIYDAFRYVGNHMNMVQLGFSLFHATAESINSVISQAGLGVKQALEGHPVRGIGTTLKAPLAPFTLLSEGSKVLKEMQQPGSQGGDFARLADSVVAGGGRGSTDSTYQTGDLGKFVGAIRGSESKLNLLRAPFAAVEGFSHLLMNYVVPRLKLGAMSQMARVDLERLGPNASRDDVRRAMGHAWDSVDNRFGQLVYDNLFWSKTLKDLAMASTRSVGWNLGTIREILGGAKDLATTVPRVKSGGPLVTHRMAYSFALPFTVGLMGAIYQYLHTGKGPETLADYFNPRTGTTLPDGTEERVRLPSYMKDVSSYSSHPLTTIANKAGPALSAMQQMLSNRDYYGTKIINGDDRLVKRVGDEAKFVASQFVPFSVSSGKARQLPTLGAKAEAIAGITPAPAETVRTPAMQILHDWHTDNAPQARTAEDMASLRAKNELTNHIRLNDMPPLQAVEAAKKAGLTIQQIQHVIKDARLPAKLLPFRGVPIEVAERAFAAASPEEKRIWQAPLMAKRQAAVRRGEMATTE